MEYDDKEPPPPEPDRRFTEREIEYILKLAARSKAVEGLPGPHDPNLDELIAAAEEAGMDAGAVRRAAALQTTEGSVEGWTLTVPEVQAHLPGVGIPDHRRALVEAAQGTLRRAGRVMVSDADRFEWKESHALGRTTVIIQADGDGTDIVVRAERSGHYLGIWFAMLTLWAVLMTFIPGFEVPGVLSFSSLLVVPFMLAMPFWSRSDRKVRSQLAHAVMELLRVVDEHGRRRPRPSVPGGEVPPSLPAEGAPTG